MPKLIAPCGNDCQNCAAYKATKTKNPVLFKNIQDDYKKRFDKVVPIEDLACEGCLNDGKHLGFCFVCKIRICAIGKGYATCAECADFPCQKGSFIWTDTSVSKANLEALQISKKI